MNKIQFVVNPNPKYIDSEADGYILLNKNILRKDNKHLFEGKYTILDSSIPDEEKYGSDKKYVRELADKFISIFAELMNNEYSLALSDRQYKFLIGIWLNNFLFDAYDRYQRIKKIKEVEGVYTVIGDFPTALSNQQQYGYINAYVPDYQMGLYGALFKELHLNVKNLHDVNNCNKFDKKLLLIKRLNSKFLKAVKNPRKIINWLLRQFETEKIMLTARTLVVESRMPKTMEEEIRLQTSNNVCFVSPKYFWKKQWRLAPEKKCGGKIRQCIREVTVGTTDFEQFVCSLIADFMPQSFIEFFRSTYEMSCKMTKKWNFGKIYHSAHITELFAMCCAIMSKKGTEIISIQHSAVYGGLKFFGYNECDVWDRFACWGWNPEGGEFLNVTRVGMSRVPLKPTTTAINSTKILMVVGIPELSDTGCGWRYDNYVEEQKQFIENLTELERQNLYIRVRTTDMDKSGGLVEWCNENYPMVKIEDANQIRFPESLAQSALLICDYYGSSHLEALMLGKPFTMFEGAKIIGFNPKTKEFFDKFEEFGVYKKTGKELAKEIVAHKNYSEWLYSNELQLIYKKYLNELTRANENLMELWVKEFNS